MSDVGCLDNLGDDGAKGRHRLSRVFYDDGICIPFQRAVGNFIGMCEVLGDNGHSPILGFCKTWCLIVYGESGSDAS
jgi:hypothetical protein